MSEYRRAEGTQPPLWETVGPDGSLLRERRTATRASQGCGLSRCPRCYNPVMFVVSVPSMDIAAIAREAHRQGAGYQSRVRLNFIVDQTYPEARRYDAHAAWPQKIQKAFVDAQMMYDEGKSPALVLSACRSVLDVATKADGGDEGKSIAQRIDQLAELGKLIGAIREWAHKVRRIGNDATHDLDEGTAEEARQVIEFIKLFLHVTFELPASIRERESSVFD